MADPAEPTTPEGAAAGGEGGSQTPAPEVPAEDKTFTQADLDKIVKDRLERERQKFADYTDLKSKAQQLDELKEANKTDQEKLEGRATKAEQRATELETKLARYEVAAEKNLPGELAEFLTGSKEEMAAKADTLLERLKTDDDPPKVPGFDGGVRDTPPPEQKPEDAHNALVLALTKGPQNQ